MNQSTHAEKLLSGLGGALSILTVFWAIQYFEQGLHARLLLIASMGATAVLLFAAPKSPFSQPWNVIGGHTVSALIGVIIHQQIADPVVGGGLAVGLAITAMYYLKCLHPPGGATSLIPLITGSVIDSYGYLFVLFPVGAGALLMVLFATLFNYPFSWRRYPAALAAQVAPKSQHAETPAGEIAYPDITHADLVTALSEIDTYVDIAEEDLLRIYEIASGRAHPQLGDTRQQ